MKKGWNVLGLLLFLLPLTGLAQQREKVTYRHTFILNGTYAPQYLAIDKGYFAEQGLEAEFFEGRGSGRNVQLMGAGAETFASSDFGVVSKAVADGVPIKAIFGELQETPMGIISLAETGIKSPKDLVGKMLAAFPGSANSQIFPAVLKVNNIDIKQVKLVFADPAALHTLLMQKRVDGILLHFHDNVPLLESRGANVTYLKYSEWGVNQLGNGIVANRKTLQEKPDMVRRFIQAFARGIKYSEANPEEAIAALMKRGPRASKEVLLKTFLNAIPLGHTKYSKGKPVGWMAKEDWDNTQELMLQYGEQKKRLPVEEFYTNEFIPAT